MFFGVYLVYIILQTFCHPLVQLFVSHGLNAHFIFRVLAFKHAFALIQHVKYRPIQSGRRSFPALSSSKRLIVPNRLEIAQVS